MKNLLELKIAQRVLIDGNEFKNNWPASQQGWAILFTPRAESGAALQAVVQDITATKTADGNLLRRITLQLKELPKIAPRPAVKPVPPPKKLSVSIGTMPVGGSTSQFSTTAPKIYARWQGHGLRVGAKIRAVWISEKLAGAAPPDQTIDEASTIANSADAHGVFTLSRPEEGWTINPLERGTLVLLVLDPTVGHEQRGVRPCVAVSDPDVIADQRFPSSP